MNVGVGQIISRTLAMVIERFGALLGLWAVFFAAQIVMSVLFFLIMGASAATGFAMGNSAALGAGMIFGMMIFYVIYFLIYFAQMAALIAMASPLQRLSFGDALNAGVRSAPTMLGVTVLFMIAYFVVALVFGIVGGILSLAGSAAVVLFGILLFPAMAYLFCRLSMVNSVIAVERVGNPVTAISRGWSIAGGHVLTIFLSFLLFGLAALLVIAALIVPFYSSITTAATTGGMPNFAMFGALVIGFIIFGIVFAIVASALFSVLHGEIAGESGWKTSEVFS